MQRVEFFNVADSELFFFCYCWRGLPCLALLGKHKKRPQISGRSQRVTFQKLRPNRELAFFILAQFCSPPSGRLWKKTKARRVREKLFTNKSQEAKHIHTHTWLTFKLTCDIWAGSLILQVFFLLLFLPSEACKWWMTILPCRIKERHVFLLTTYKTSSRSWAWGTFFSPG